MSFRKKRLILIQSILLITAIILLYIFYYQGNVKNEATERVKIENEKLEKLSDSNYFEDVEYKGIDANGNRYVLESEIATFNDESPELVQMIGMNATLFKDGKILKVSGKTGVYNNKTNDMKFRDNVKVVQAQNRIFADNLDYLI